MREEGRRAYNIPRLRCNASGVKELILSRPYYEGSLARRLDIERPQEERWRMGNNASHATRQSLQTHHVFHAGPSLY